MSHGQYSADDFSLVQRAIDRADRNTTQYLPASRRRMTPIFRANEVARDLAEVLGNPEKSDRHFHARIILRCFAGERVTLREVAQAYGTIVVAMARERRNA